MPIKSGHNGGEWFRRGVISGAALLLSGCQMAPVQPPPEADVPPVPSVASPPQAPSLASFEDGRIVEASGIQRSLRHAEVYWVHNDGADATLFVTDSMGRALGRVGVTGFRPVDWEDIGAFVLDGTPYLVLGDTGDNRARRPEILLQVIPEPDIGDLSTGFEMQAAPGMTIRLRYAEGGAYDCEALAIDVRQDEILIVTKDMFNPANQGLWTAPLRESLATGYAELRFRTPVAGSGLSPQAPGNVLNPLLLAGQFRNAITGMDIHPDGQSLAILTYGGIYLWQRQAGESWADALSRPNHAALTLPAGGDSQAEGIAYSPDGQWLLLVAERNLLAPSPSTISVIRPPRPRPARR